MSKAIELNSETFDQHVLQSSVPVLVDFWAPWCGPCRMMAPILDELAGEMEGKIRIAKLDTQVPTYAVLADKYDIRSIPNMKLFSGGKVIKELVGFRPKEVLRGELEECI